LAWCNPCGAKYQREWRARNIEKTRRQVYKDHISRTYGISLEEYDRRFEAQGGLCAICGQEEPSRNRDGTRRHLTIDHDHLSGQIRKLLCSLCNRGLGGFRDDPALVERGIAYLKYWSEQA
jgi:hypothetical protein